MKEIITKTIITCYEIYRLYLDAAKGDRTSPIEFSNHRLPCWGLSMKDSLYPEKLATIGFQGGVRQEVKRRVYPYTSSF
jgi:hypothetical protein